METSLLDRVHRRKSRAPNLPGDFTGKGPVNQPLSLKRHEKDNLRLPFFSVVERPVSVVYCFRRRPFGASLTA